MKAKKIVSTILLSVYVIAMYWILDRQTEYPLALLVTIFASVLFSVITHELGHLIAGLLTGYRFVSFRIFSFMLVRSEGKWKIRRMSVPGTGGQCLMAPPRKKNGYYPFALYNLGGILLCGLARCNQQPTNIAAKLLGVLICGKIYSLGFIHQFQPITSFI